MAERIGLRITMKEKLIGFIFLSILTIQAPSYSQEDSFNVWLDALREEAESRGFSEESINIAFSEIKGPVERIVSNDRNQAEDVETYAEYLNIRVNNWKKTNGNELMKEIQERTQGRWVSNPGVIYPMLGFMEEHGLVESEWEDEKRRTRRFYRITTRGANELARLKDVMKPRLMEALDILSHLLNDLYAVQA